jgi:ribosomal protein S1
MDVSSQASPAQPADPLAAKPDQQEIEQEVNQALGGMSIEDLMAQSLSRSATTQPNLDPSRPTRGGRPGPRRGGESEGTHPDNVKHGRVTAIREGNVFVDIGGKSQGVCPLEQFDTVPDNEELRAVEIGQEYEFVFKGYDTREGLVMLSRKGAIQHGAWESLTVGDTVEAQVTGVNRGGLELKVNNARAFMPAGQVDTKFHSDLSVYLNQRITAIVTQVDRTTHNIVLSRRELVQQEEAKNAEKTWEELAAGQIREGTVRSVMPYGAFVDLGGVDGLLHVSAMSHTRVSDPKKIVKEGDKIQVMVLSADKDARKVSLGLKQLAKDPWGDVESQFPIGTNITGHVKKVMEFGAFVELAPGVEGLVHISQLSTKRIGKATEVVKDGQIVTAKVTAIDLAKKRISLSMADVERDLRATAAPSSPATPTTNGAPTTTTTAKPTTRPQPKKNLKGGL